MIKNEGLQRGVLGRAGAAVKEGARKRPAPERTSGQPFTRDASCFPKRQRLRLWQATGSGEWIAGKKGWNGRDQGCCVAVEKDLSAGN